MTKLTTLKQVEMLRIDDIVKRFPSNTEPEEVFDESRNANIDTYEIRSIHPGNQMIELVMERKSIPMFSLPGDVARLFIKSYHLVEQKIWWV
jgi:hypothetical protein